MQESCKTVSLEWYTDRTVDVVQETRRHESVTTLMREPHNPKKRKQFFFENTKTYFCLPETIAAC